MKNIISFFVLICSVAVIIVSCAEKEESTTAADAAATPAISSFNGTFIGTCAGADAKTFKMVIADTTAAESRLIYSDSACSTKKWGYTLNYTVTSTATATEEGGKSVTKIEGTTTTSFITLYTDAYVSNANDGSGWCGKTDWVKDTAQNVTGVNCSNSLGLTFSAAGIKKYDIWYLSGNTFMNSGAFDSEGYASSLDDLIYTKE